MIAPPVNAVRSQDGTQIAFDRSGEGPPLIVVGGAFTLRQVLPGSESAAHVAHFVADDLSDLSTEQLREVLSSLDEIVASDTVAVPESSTDLRELDAQQLRAVLRSLEG